MHNKTTMRITVCVQLLALWIGVFVSNPACSSSPGEQRLNGPLPGAMGMRSVKIWLQSNHASRAHLRYWPNERPAEARTSAEMDLQESQQFSTVFVLTDLTPGTEYTYEVYFHDQKYTIDPPLHFKTQPLWQWRSEPPAFHIALGSCTYINDTPFDRPGRPYGGAYGIFDAIAAQKPDAMLWLGDNVYFREVDFDHPEGMAYRYRHDRETDALQQLFRTTHHYAIWDDHDFGRNDSNSSFEFKHSSLNLFQRYWPNPSFGLPETPGIFTRFTLYDVEFFLLDDRSYRDSDRAPDGENKLMLGAAQLRWLQNALLTSNATFKIVANGSQMFNDANTFEGWNHFKNERRHFTEWLSLAKIKGVFFLSGDRHHTELLKYERAADYPLYELTCSPLTSGARAVNDKKEESHIVSGTMVGKRNFCGLSFDGKRKNRTMTISVYDSHGQVLWYRQIGIGELSPVQ